MKLAGMDAAAMAKAADLLWANWRDGTILRQLPPDAWPTTREEGYAVQSQLEARSAWPVFGWKIAATSRMGQAHIGVDGPIAGRILAERVLPGGGEVPAGANRMAVAEPEFAFRMGRELPPRAERHVVDEVLDAVASLHPAIELPDSRFEEFAAVGGPHLIADNACAHWFVLGEETNADWRSLDLAAHRVVGRIEGRLEREGSGAAVLGDARVALTWLVDELSSLGITLREGQVVTTGTCMPPLEIRPGDRVTADFGEIGSVSIRIEG